MRLDHVQVELAGEHGLRLRTTARECGTSIEIMVQAAWSIVLDGLTGDGDLDETMPIRSLLTGTGRPADAVVRLEHGEIDTRVRLTRPGTRISVPRRADRAGLEVSLTPAVTLRLSYPTSGLGRCAADKLVDCLLRVLEAMAVAPDQPICRVEVLGDEDRRCIEARWTDEPAAGPTVAQLFEDQVDRAPRAVAMTDGEHALTYPELDRAANRLAHWLIAQEADPARPVLLDATVSPQLVVGLLAALKAGRACLVASGHADGIRPAEAGRRQHCPDTRAPRPAAVPASARFVTVAGAARGDAGATIHHGELLNLLLNGCPRWPAAPRRPSAGSPADLVTTVLLPLITGATLVVVPDSLPLS